MASIKLNEEERSSFLAPPDKGFGNAVSLRLVWDSRVVTYPELASYFAPIRALAWIMAIMIATTVVLTGANSLNTTVQDRIRELATLRAIGYGGAALVTSLLIEALLLATAAGMTGLVLARIAVQNTTFQIGMGAFALEVGGAAILAGFSGVLLIGLLGTLPASVRLLRMHVAAALVED